MDLTNYKNGFSQTIEFLKKDISSLRTGRASTAIVEDLAVFAYGVKQPMKAVGSINVPDAKTVTIEPWDKSLLAEIEKAVKESNLGINPVNRGNQIILAMPELTTERRQELIKVLHQKLEQARISVRKIREQARDEIISAVSNKQITEDEKYRLQEDLDKLVKEYNEKIKEIGDKKEKEINLV